MDKISIIVPCYNEQEAIPIFYDAIAKTEGEMPQVRLEVLFVNDGSRDASLMEKSFVGKRPRTACRITAGGRKAMEEYVETLKGYLSGL